MEEVHTVEVYHFSHNLENFTAFDYVERKMWSFELARIRSLMINDSGYSFKESYELTAADEFCLVDEPELHVALDMDATAKDYMVEFLPKTLTDVLQVTDAL